MRNTYNNSFSEDLGSHEVEVLLATFNGELHIRDFLESLAQQRTVEIHLLVSDDGSSDQTLAIIEEYRVKFKTLEIIPGPKKGPAENFFHLIKKASLEFIALADQDDIWLPDHLYNSINRLLLTRQKPSLTASRVWETTFNSSTANIWPFDCNAQLFPRILFENQVRGCTIVFNKSFMNILNQLDNQAAVMHDWWIGITGWCFAEFTYSKNPEIIYRLHDKQAVGNKDRNIWQQMHFFARHGFATHMLHQIYALNQCVGKYQTGNYAIALKFINLLDSPMSERRMILKRDLMLRTVWHQDLTLKIFLFLGIPQRVLKIWKLNQGRKTS